MDIHVGLAVHIFLPFPCVCQSNTCFCTKFTRSWCFLGAEPIKSTQNPAEPTRTTQNTLELVRTRQNPSEPPRTRRSTTWSTAWSTWSMCGRRFPFPRPTGALWSQSWQRQAPKDRVFSIKISCHPWWSEKKSNPWSYQVHVWILRARTCGTPFYGVDLLLMSLERVNGCNLVV